MTVSTIEAEIVTLIQEISKLEKELDNVQDKARTYKGWTAGEKYTEQARDIESKIDRKIQLLKILKG